MQGNVPSVTERGLQPCPRSRDAVGAGLCRAISAAISTRLDSGGCRIEGSRLSDREVERLLSNLAIRKFETRDEQEVAGYAELMELMFRAWEDIPLNENHIKQLHQILLQYSYKDERHRGAYKTSPNSVAAFDADGVQLAVVFETATPFDTHRAGRAGAVKLPPHVHEDRARRIIDAPSTIIQIGNK